MSYDERGRRATAVFFGDRLLPSPSFAGIDIPSPSVSFTEPGEGVSGRIGVEEVYVGRSSWVSSQLGIRNPDVQAAGEATGSTTVWVGSSIDGLLGSLVFSDTLRPDAAEVVRHLYQKGKRVVILSGDDESVARSVALEAGIRVEDVYGRVRPEGKADFVSQLRTENGLVAMVGDGVNDAVALSAADVGIAMGGGSDAAGAASSVVLMGDRLTQVVEAINLGEDTFAKIKQNLALAVAYNVIGIPIAAGALLPAYGVALSPTFAAGMMACSSIIVVTNSLLLRQSKR